MLGRLDNPSILPRLFVVIDSNLLIGTGAIGPCRPKSFARECLTLAAEVQSFEKVGTLVARIRLD